MRDIIGTHLESTGILNYITQYTEKSWKMGVAKYFNLTSFIQRKSMPYQNSSQLFISRKGHTDNKIRETEKKKERNHKVRMKYIVTY